MSEESGDARRNGEAPSETKLTAVEPAYLDEDVLLASAPPPSMKKTLREDGGSAN